MKLKKGQYWICIIGPVKRSELGHGYDSNLRRPVVEAFEKTFGSREYECASGWGTDEVRSAEVLECWSWNRNSKTPFKKKQEKVLKLRKILE